MSLMLLESLLLDGFVKDLKYIMILHLTEEKYFIMSVLSRILLYELIA
jgi:hypothetical protein